MTIVGLCLYFSVSQCPVGLSPYVRIQASDVYGIYNVCTVHLELFGRRIYDHACNRSDTLLNYINNHITEKRNAGIKWYKIAVLYGALCQFDIGIEK